MQSFRASPWVSYEPSLPSQDRDQAVSESEMDEDVDMEAPQISTLRVEDVHYNKKKRSHKVATGATEAGDEGDEEDQLIDELIDDDDAARFSPSGRPLDVVQKRKASVKKKSRKGERKAGETEKKRNAASEIVPTISVFKANPEDVDLNGSLAPNPPAESSTQKTKKSPSRKSNAVPRKLAKLKFAASHLLPEDTGVLSESYAGTAASSPVTAVFEQNTPEPENIQPSSPLASSAPMLDEPPNLENVPIPVYPLPTKPFPVQPPPKISTGFAPLIPLDKGHGKVRHWRKANREIRGIAGGRWFAKTWAGDKDSQFATRVAKPGDKVATSKSSSTPATSKGVSKLKSSKTAATSVANSANASRAPSVAPEHGVTSSVRAPTKMRISQKAPSDIEATPGA